MAFLNCESSISEFASPELTVSTDWFHFMPTNQLEIFKEVSQDTFKVVFSWNSTINNICPGEWERYSEIRIYWLHKRYVIIYKTA